MKRVVLLLVFVALSACAPAVASSSLSDSLSASPPPPPPSLKPTPSPLPLPTASPTPTPVLHPPVERVLIVSFDGLRPDAIDVAPMENVLRLMQVGAYHLGAQTVLPSTTLPAYASMVSGMCPARHGVYWNEYVPQNGYAMGTDLFDLARLAGLRTVMLVSKQKLRHLTEPESTETFVVRESDSTLGVLAAAEIKKGFGLMLVHFYEGDRAGHEWGWLSAPQLAAFRRADRALGEMLRALDESPWRSTTLILVTADHGGIGYTHGGDSPGETTIPWVIVGPGVRPGPLRTPIHVIDTAATAAYALGLPLPPEWDGLPVYEAFGQPPAIRLNADPCRQTR